MKPYHQNLQRNDYEENRTCFCGRKSDHVPLGLCWICYDARFESSLAVVTQHDRKAELERLGLLSEDRGQLLQNIFNWHVENRSFATLKRAAMERIK